MLSHGSEGVHNNVILSDELYISMLSHGSEGSTTMDTEPIWLQYSTNSHGSEGRNWNRKTSLSLYISMLSHGSEG